MSLEDLTGSDKYIDDLVNTNPASGDPKSEGDDHITGIKNVLGNQFPNLTGAVSATQAELNLLDGVTSSTAELNLLDGVTASTAELNILDGVTSTAAELNILDGVTSTAAELNLMDGLTTVEDEDDMASDSDTSLATQQSIKAYADAAVEWTVVTTSDSPVTAAFGKRYFCDLTSGAITITLPNAGAANDGQFVGIKVDHSASTNNLTINCVDSDTIVDEVETTLVVDTDHLEATLVYDDTNTNWGF